MFNRGYFVLFFAEGKLKVYDNKKRFADRYVFLCDGMIIVCKQIANKRGSVSSSANSGEYRLREKHLIRKVDVLDREDSGSDAHTFELAPRDQPKIIFKAESEEEKNSWMAALVMLNTKFTLERLLDVILTNEERKYPLRFPPSDKYKFAEENHPSNIVFEEREKPNGVPLIKGATLVKLVERLTYHIYADPTFMKTFLTTYRSFSTPHELLDLLISVSQFTFLNFSHLVLRNLTCSHFFSASKSLTPSSATTPTSTPTTGTRTPSSAWPRTSSASARSTASRCSSGC